MKIKRGSIVVIVVAVALATGILLFLRRDKPLVSPTPQNSAPRLPETTFDSTATIPGTRLSFSYPSKGFYGIGADLKTFTYADGSASGNHTEVTVQSTAPYAYERGSEFVTLWVVARNRRSEEKILEDVVNAFDPNSINGQYAKLTGEYRTFNDQKFFVMKAAEDVTTWSALTLLDDDAIWISLAYKATDGAESQAAYEHNDQLFIDILSRVKVE